jgi:hypothetical protein
MEKKAKRITIVAEMMMYGFTSLTLEQEGSSVNAYYGSMADGGIVVDDEEKKFEGKDLDALAEIICEMTFNDDIMTDAVCWGVSIAGEDEDTIYEVETDCWPPEILAEIVDAVNKFTGDSAVTESISKMMGWIEDDE